MRRNSAVRNTSPAEHLDLLIVVIQLAVLLTVVFQLRRVGLRLAKVRKVNTTE